MLHQVRNPRIGYGDEAHLVPESMPRISWITETDAPNWRQEAAELRLTLEGREHTARIDGEESTHVEWPFERLQARAQGELRVRVLGPDGWSEWSQPSSFLTSFLDEGEWCAQFIGLPNPPRHATPFLARGRFTVRQGLRRATWYGTAQGVYQAWVNSREVDDQILKPGWTPYQFRIIHETSDVTELLSVGDNVLGLAVAGGWFTEHFGFQGQAQPLYGTQPSVAGQLCLEYEDGSQEWVSTDASWRCTEGPWETAGIYWGEDYDARKMPEGWHAVDFTDHNWQAPVIMADSPTTPEPRTSPAVRVVETLPVQEVLTSPSGARILDFGQNLVGRLRIKVKGEAGDTIGLRHAEVLEDGELGVRPLRAARASDVYILAGKPDGEEYAPIFTFHGFRYAEVSGWPGELDPKDITAEVIFSDMRRTGWFECSNGLVNRLHENVVWGMRGNFLYLPTDCPQRDERLGWTGDIQMFAPTAAFLHDCNGFLASWLKDLALEQEAAGGGVAFVVPDVLDSGKTPAAAWGDAATVVPSVLHERFGDRSLLERQYPSMKQWVDVLHNIAGTRQLWEGGFQFGDWVDPDAPADEPSRAKTDPDLVASAYLYRSTRLLAEAAKLLGNTDDAQHYGQYAEEVRKAWLAEYVTANGRIVSDAQTAYALAIDFGIATGQLAQQLGDRLAWLARRDGYRISTGFVGTPLVTHALSTTGHNVAAGRMLLQTECPSWLYSVTMGATTIWERWDSLLPDGSINTGEMTSFNHYALGAVADWLHRVVAGLAPAEPGYKKVSIAPRPIPGLDWAQTSHEGPYGRIEVGWKLDGNTHHVTAVIPPNSGAVVSLPGQEPFEVGSGSHEWQFHGYLPEPTFERIGPDTPLSSIIDDEEAYRVIVDAFEAVSPTVKEDFQRRTRWIPNQALHTSFSLISRTMAERVMERVEELNDSRGLTK